MTQTFKKSAWLGAAAMAFTAGSAFGVTVGNDLTNRPSHDGASGSIFFIGQEAAAGEVSTFGFYDDNFAGRQITPVILKAVGNDYEITGIGTTRTSDGSGAQTFDFGLVSGDAELGAGEVLGWKDGSNGSNNAGVPEFDNAAPGQVTWQGAGQTSFAVGDTLTSQTNFTRTYSFQGEVNSDVTEAVGNVLINRGSNDGASGSIFVVNDGFTQAGNVLQWAMFDDDGASREITPLLLQQGGSGWEILGIGTTRVSDGSGAQYFDFGLVSGSDATGTGIFLGWKDGGNGTNNGGVADFDTITGGPSVTWLGAGRTSFGVGDSYGVSGTFDRSYSIQAITTAVPEPATAMLGLAGLGALAFRRRQR